MITSSPIQELGPGATPLPWWAFSLLAILSDRSSRKQKYLDYDRCSRRWSRTTERPCLARDGVGVIIQPAYNNFLLVNFYA